MATEVRLQALISSTVAGAMMSPPYTFLAVDRGYQVFGRGKDYVRYLTEGVVTSESKIKQKRSSLVRFLRSWNRSVNYYRANPAVMVAYIQKVCHQRRSISAENVRGRRDEPDGKWRNRQCRNRRDSGNGKRDDEGEDVYFCQSTFRFFLAPGNKMRTAEAQHSQASFCRHSVACAITCPWAMK